MSVNADLEDVKKILENRKQDLQRFPNADPGMKAITLRNIALAYIILGDYKAARDAFYQEVKEQDRQIEKDGLNKFNYYGNTLSSMELSLLTLDEDLMRKRTEKIYTNPPDDWKKHSAQYYYMLQAYVGLILGWEDSKLKEIIEEGKKVGKHTVSEAALVAIEGILDKDLEKFQDGYQQLVRHHVQKDGRRSNTSRKYTSTWCITLVIFALKRGLDLKEFDPPFVDMGYLKLYKPL